MMAEPLSFVASLIAIAALAEKVVTRGYRYLKAVKSCPDEVRNLMAETNVLCGILGRLNVLLKGTNRSTSEATLEPRERASQDSDNDDENSSEDDAVSSEGENIWASDNSTALRPPDFIYECEKTLHEIEKVLKGFQQTNRSKQRFKVTKLRRMEAKDLKWPLQKSETMQLIEALERHKNTCTLALAGNGLAGIHTVLEQTKFSNKCLANLMAKQEKLFELNITREQGESLAWLSSVNPASKLQTFRRERQRGTGRWLFDLPEMSAWLKDSNSALWIYGIPGAGKTILSTLVVDEVLARKRSSSIGTAYFYVRHDDKNSQIFSNLLGSLISQLARQNLAALNDVVELHERRRREGPLITSLEDEDLIRLLFNISNYFMDTFIMIDGLDECGSCFDGNRERLIDRLAKIHQYRDCQIHTLIFSRDELDIKKRLTATGFQIVSIAARSADLRLYVNAWLPSLNIQSETLKIEVVDTLVDEAHGMFMWVRAQIDYLRRLPTDTEKRKALKRLPPDLPQTYVRILEIIDRTYPPQTTKFIQRLLKWLVLQISGAAQIYSNARKASLTSRMLCHAICIENESGRFSDSEIPPEEQILGWLGCLARRSKTDDMIELSHFTIKEFLIMDPADISSAVARKYLVQPEDYNYLVTVCLIYLMYDDFRSMTCSNSSEAWSFITQHPLYEYVTLYLCDYIHELTMISAGMNQEVKGLMQRFLSIPVHEAFLLWDTYHTGLDTRDYCIRVCEIGNYLSPLHFACLTGLVEEVERLCRQGLDPNCTSLPSKFGHAYTPLHLTLLNNRPYLAVQTISFSADPIDFDNAFSEANLQIIRALLNAGANVNQQLIVDIDDYYESIITPLSLAVLLGFSQVACILLDEGADCKATASENPRGLQDLCSIEKLLDGCPHAEESVQRAVDLGGHQGLKRTLERWRGRQKQSTVESDGHPMQDIHYSATSQERFIDAYRNGRWAVVRQLLEAEPDIEMDGNDEQGTNLLFCASEAPSEHLRHLLERGANPNPLTASGHGVLSKTAAVGRVENMSLLVELGADIEQRDPRGWTPLLNAIWFSRHEMVKRLLAAGASPNAVLDNGAEGIHLAIENADPDMFSLLLERGFDPAAVDNYGSTPLHLACEKGRLFAVEKLIPTALDRINDDSLSFGTPLYAATRQGFVSVVRALLDAGAAIDKTGPGNLFGSALMVACAKGHGDIVNLLLSRGASREVEGSRFRSAAGTARAFRQEKILKVLEEYPHNMSETEKL